MLIAETRPSSRGGVTDCRKVVVEITHRIGPTPSRKKLNAASAGLGTAVVSAITPAATKPVTGPSPITVPNATRFITRVAAIVMAITTFVPSPLLAGLSFFLLGVGPILWVISTTTLRQSVTPPRLLGRVSAINILSYGARPLGSALGAIVGGLYGAEACLYLAVAIFAAQALVILLSPAVSLARQPEMIGDGCRA